MKLTFALTPVRRPFAFPEIGASAGVRIVHGNGAGPERGYGAEAPSSDVRAAAIAAPRATIHRLR